MNIFDRYYERYNQWYEKNRFAYLSELEAVKRALPKRGRGLEVGVGTGRFAIPLGIEFGIDPSEKMLEIAKEKGVNVKKGNGEDLPFKDAFFDFVAIIIAICFVKDPQRVLREANRVLKKDGRIILGIVDKESFLGKFYKEKKSLFYERANFFSVSELTDLLQSEGFKDFSYYQTLYDFPEKIESVQQIEEGYGKGGFVVISAFK